MAVPKRKTSKARRDKRRSAVWKLETPAMCKCDNCGAYKAPHKVCKNCGKTFSTFAELVADRPKLKKEQVEEVAEKPTDEKPKKSTKKGAK